MLTCTYAWPGVCACVGASKLTLSSKMKATVYRRFIPVKKMGNAWASCHKQEERRDVRYLNRMVNEVAGDQGVVALGRYHNAYVAGCVPVCWSKPALARTMKATAYMRVVPVKTHGKY